MTDRQKTNKFKREVRERLNAHREAAGMPRRAPSTAGVRTLAQDDPRVLEIKARLGARAVRPVETLQVRR